MHDVSTPALGRSVRTLQNRSFVAPENAVLYSAESEVDSPPEEMPRGSLKPNKDTFVKNALCSLT
jgi:hypothetical protein